MTRPILRVGDSGKAVTAAKRGVANYFETRDPVYPASRQFGPFFLLLVKKLQKEKGIPQSGVIGPHTWFALERYLDATALKLLADVDPARLVEPNQGFDSLHESLWRAYSDGRRRNFTDLGTYVNKPGDHGAGPPCYAFDLGREDRFLFKGWGYLAARRLAIYYVKNHERLNINYVILGRQVWSRERPYWHPLTTGDTSHDFHLHISGIH